MNYFYDEIIIVLVEWTFNGGTEITHVLLCFEDEQNTDRFKMSWEWVINGRLGSSLKLLFCNYYL